MYGLATEGLAPKFLTKVTKNGNPRNCVWFTVACMWVVLILGLVSEITGALEDSVRKPAFHLGIHGNPCMDRNMYVSGCNEKETSRREDTIRKHA